MNTLQIPSRRQSIIECLSLLVLATVLRVLFVGKTDLGRDESFSLYISLQGVPDIVCLLIKGDNPPLWEILLHFWIKLFGISEVAIRSLSLIFSTLTIIPLYFLGERHIHRFAGISAALYYSFSTFSIYMAHDCRVYSLIGCCAANSVWLFVSAIHEPKRFKFVLLTLVNLMLMYGHYLSVWIIVMEFFIALIVKPIRKKIWKFYLIHAAALIVLFAPMFPVLFTRFSESGLRGTWIEKTTSPKALYDFLWRMCNVPVTTVLAIILLFAILIKLIANISQRKHTFGNTGLLSLLWVFPLLVSFVLSYFTGFFLDRYFYFLFPVFYLSVSAYCLFLFPKRKIFGMSLMGAFALTMAFSCSPDSSTKHFSGPHYDIKPIVNQLTEAKVKENALVILPEYFDKQFTYYLDENHEVFRTQNQPTNYYVFRNYLHSQGYYYDYSYPHADLAHYSIIMFAYHESLPINGLSEYLENKGFRLEQSHEVNHYFICRYVRP